MRRLLSFASWHDADVSHCFTQLMTRRSIMRPCYRRSCADRLLPHQRLRARLLRAGGQRRQPDEIP
jgi:hypothetical protein